MWGNLLVAVCAILPAKHLNTTLSRFFSGQICRPRLLDRNHVNHKKFELVFKKLIFQIVISFFSQIENTVFVYI